MISPERQTIEQIMGRSKLTYSVPRYQRTFDWGKNELEELVADLIETENKELFLGNFIFDISNSSDFQIVDGQQRLTSISIIFIALREQAKILNEPDMQTEIQRCISNYSKIRKTNEVKISVSENIKTIFDYMAHPTWDGQFPEQINGKSIKRQINKIKPVYNHIFSKIDQFNSDRLGLFVQSLWDAYVVVINVESNEMFFPFLKERMHED